MKTLENILEEYLLLKEEKQRKLKFIDHPQKNLILNSTMGKLEQLLDDYILMKNNLQIVTTSSQIIEQNSQPIPQEKNSQERANTNDNNNNNNNGNKNSPFRRKRTTPKKLEPNSNSPSTLKSTCQPLLNESDITTTANEELLKLSEKLAEHINEHLLQDGSTGPSVAPSSVEQFSLSSSNDLELSLDEEVLEGIFNSLISDHDAIEAVLRLDHLGIQPQTIDLTSPLQSQLKSSKKRGNENGEVNQRSKKLKFSKEELKE